MLSRKKPLARGEWKKKAGEPMKRSEMSRKPGRRVKAKRVKTVSALDTYFERFGWDDGDGKRFAHCQLCGSPTQKGAGLTDPCHKERSWKGDHDAKNLLAGHHRCHQWLDAKGSRGPREMHVKASPVNMETGGVVWWPEDLWESLSKAIGLMGAGQSGIGAG